MQNLFRAYGRSPFRVVVIHGGPGAAGEVAPVAQELSSDRGILEPFQTAITLEGQVEELNQFVKRHAQTPAVFIGFSWGAWLSVLCAAKYPGLIKKLILVSSGSFDEKYVANDRIENVRFTRLDDAERKEVAALFEILGRPADRIEKGRTAEGGRSAEKDRALSRIGALFSKTDAFDPIPGADLEDVDCRADIFQGVWTEAAALRKSGELLEQAKKVRCPVVAIHGDHDPHPALGVKEPLSAAIPDFRFILLEKCGHKPWIERYARQEFFDILRDELNKEV